MKAYQTTCSIVLGIVIGQKRKVAFNCLSHSRFNRRSRQLLQLIYQIRQEMNKKVDLNGQFLVIDSFPVPVCQPIRNYRAKIFRGYANLFSTYMDYRQEDKFSFF